MRESYPFEVAALAFGPPVAALIAYLILQWVWLGFRRPTIAAPSELPPTPVAARTTAALRADLRTRAQVLLLEPPYQRQEAKRAIANLDALDRAPRKEISALPEAEVRKRPYLRSIERRTVWEHLRRFDHSTLRTEPVFLFELLFDATRDVASGLLKLVPIAIMVAVLYFAIRWVDFGALVNVEEWTVLGVIQVVGVAGGLWFAIVLATQDRS